MRNLIPLGLLVILAGGCGEDDGAGLGDFFGVDLRQLTTDGGSSPAWSPGGEEIIYTNRQDLWLITAEGGNPVRITTMSGPERSPLWHPNNTTRKIVFINNPDPDTFVMYTLQLDGGEPLEILSTTTNISSPSFTSNGDRIAYVNSRRGQGIYLIDPSGDGQAVQLDNSDGWELVTAARCSPVEDRIAYIENRADDLNIFLLPLSGGQPEGVTSYTNTAGDINKLWALDWRRDGSEIAFTHSANLYSFTSALFTISADGAGLKAWTEDPLDGVVDYKTPSYALDGNRLVCEHAGELWILELR